MEKVEQEHDGLHESRLRRIAVVKQHEDFLQYILISKRKGIKFRRFFCSFVRDTASRVFKSLDEEYEVIGKPGRSEWTDYEKHMKSFDKCDKDKIIEILHEFGCYDY